MGEYIGCNLIAQCLNQILPNCPCWNYVACPGGNTLIQQPTHKNTPTYAHTPTHMHRHAKVHANMHIHHKCFFPWAGSKSTQQPINSSLTPWWQTHKGSLVTPGLLLRTRSRHPHHNRLTLLPGTTEVTFSGNITKHIIHKHTQQPNLMEVYVNMLQS